MVWLKSDAGSMGIGVLGARIAVDNVSRRVLLKGSPARQNRNDSNK